MKFSQPGVQALPGYRFEAALPQLIPGGRASRKHSNTEYWNEDDGDFGFWILDFGFWILDFGFTLRWQCLDSAAQDWIDSYSWYQ